MNNTQQWDVWTFIYRSCTILSEMTFEASVKIFICDYPGARSRDWTGNMSLFAQFSPLGCDLSAGIKTLNHLNERYTRVLTETIAQGTHRKLHVWTKGWLIGNIARHNGRYKYVWLEILVLCNCSFMNELCSIDV